MKFRFLPVYALVALLAACDPKPVVAPAPAPVATAPAPAAAPAAPAETINAEQKASAETEALEAVTESDALEVEDKADTKIALPEAPAAPATSRFQDGTHYRRLTTAQGTSSAPDKIEVAEFFWYGCPHCANFEPVLSDWEKKLPADVTLVRIPVMWNPVNEVHARMFYTAEALGKLKEIHPAAFRAVHGSNNPLTTPDSQEDFFATFGVSGDEFDSTSQSFSVSGNIKRAENLTRRYQIASVPVLVVNGKYVIDGKGVQSTVEMLEVADELVASERQTR